jgi:hypothetical protein
MPPMFDFASDRGYTRSKNSGVRHEDDGCFSKLLGVLAVLTTVLNLVPPAFAAPLPQQSTHCQGIKFLWQQVHNPHRLEVQKQYVTVTVIATKVAEPDGDLHIRVKSDRPFESMLNDGNKSDQLRGLVFEPICDHSVTQADAVAAGASFHATIPRYPAGTRVVVTGSYVLDHEHGGWRFIP